MTEKAQVRRHPEQSRSRARVEAILAAATELISEQGIEPPSMTDIAERAGMGVTAVYRYFPNKQSIVRELAMTTLDLNRQELAVQLSEPLDSVDDFVRDAITAYWQGHRDEPFRLRLRAAIHADAELTALDLADTRHNAKVLGERIAEQRGEVDPASVVRHVFLIISLLDSLMLTATLLEPAEAEVMVADFTAMALALLG